MRVLFDIQDMLEDELKKISKKERMIEDLKVMMQNARTDDERNSYRKAVEQLER